MVQLRRGVAKLSRDVVYLGMVGCRAWAYRVTVTRGKTWGAAQLSLWSRAVQRGAT